MEYGEPGGGGGYTWLAVWNAGEIVIVVLLVPMLVPLQEYLQGKLLRVTV